MKHSPAPKLRQPRQHLNQPTVWPIDADASRLPGLGRRQWRLQPSVSDWRTALDPPRPQASILSNPHVTSRLLHGETIPENRKAISLRRVDAGCAFNLSKAQERSAEQEVEKSNNGGADGHGSPRLDRVRAGVPQPAFRREPSYRRSLHPTRIRSVGGTLRTLSATLHAVTLS